MLKSCEQLKICYIVIFSFCLLSRMAPINAGIVSDTTTAKPAIVDAEAAAAAAKADTAPEKMAPKSPDEKMNTDKTKTTAEITPTATTTAQAAQTATDAPIVGTKTETKERQQDRKHEHDKDADWWRHAVIYQIYPRSFMDTNGDGVGDLKGIITKLPYLAETGITAIWLSPIFASPMVDFGYDIADFKAIHREYGTMQDFEELMTESARLGINVILDFVPNHSSDQHAWFAKSADREKGFEDVYTWADGKLDETGERQPPNNWVSVFGGPAWTWNDQRKQYYLHQFTKEQPDLNFRNPKVVEMMDDAMEFWLEKGVRGFRIDAVNHLFESPDLEDEPLTGKTDDKDSYEYTKHVHTKDLPEVYNMVQHWRKLLDDCSKKHGGPKRIMMTEAYADLKMLMDYYETEDDKEGSQLPFNFLMITDLDKDSDARDYAINIQKWLTYMPRGHVANWVMGNHDNPRVASRLGSKRIDSMNMLMMTLPGVAVTYNGEEIGMEDNRDISWEDTVDPLARNAGPDNFKKVSRDPERTPFQWNAQKNAGFSTSDKTWLPVHPDYEKLNLEAQQTQAKSHYKVYKSLMKVRRLLAMTEGRTQVEVINRDVLAILRDCRDHNKAITVINVGPKEQEINLTEIFNVKSTMTVLVASSKSPLEKGNVLPTESLKLPPYEGIVCSLD